MADSREDAESDSKKAPLQVTVQRHANRKLRAKKETERAAWFGLGLFGLIGWSVAIPTLIGIAIGVWLDRQFATSASWTLTFLLIGLVFGCLNAWYWLKQESRHD